MTRILIATIALASVAGLAAAKEAPVLQGNYSANVREQAADVKARYADFTGSRSMGGSVEAPQASVHDQNYSGKYASHPPPPTAERRSAAKAGPFAADRVSFLYPASVARPPECVRWLELLPGVGVGFRRGLAQGRRALRGKGGRPLLRRAGRQCGDGLRTPVLWT